MNWESSELICCDAPAGLADYGIRDAVFAIGTFDGLHRGHVAVVQAMLEHYDGLDEATAGADLDEFLGSIDIALEE